MQVGSLSLVAVKGRNTSGEGYARHLGARTFLPRLALAGAAVSGDAVSLAVCGRP